jgi:hypothetical protein
VDVPGEQDRHISPLKMHGRDTPEHQTIPIPASIRHDRDHISVFIAGRLADGPANVIIVGIEQAGLDRYARGSYPFGHGLHIVVRSVALRAGAPDVCEYEPGVPGGRQAHGKGNTLLREAGAVERD